MSRLGEVLATVRWYGRKAILIIVVLADETEFETRRMAVVIEHGGGTIFFAVGPTLEATHSHGAVPSGTDRG